MYSTALLISLSIRLLGAIKAGEALPGPAVCLRIIPRRELQEHRANPTDSNISILNTPVSYLASPEVGGA